MFSFNISEFVWEHGKMRHNASGVQIPGDGYIFTEDGHIGVCEYLFIRNNVSSKHVTDSDGTQVLLTAIGNSISVLSSLFAIITLLEFKELRNLPGKIYINLLFWLFLANLVLLIDGTTSNKAVCFIIAILLHLSWLSIFFWTNSLAIDLTRTFRTKASSYVHRVEGSYEFVFYCVYSWTVPLAIIIACVASHFMAISDGGIYDLEMSCWLRPGQPHPPGFQPPNRHASLH